MYKRLIFGIFFSLLLHTKAFALIGLGAGYTYLTYYEKHQFQPSLDLDITQHAPNVFGEMKLMGLADLFQVGADFQYIGPAIASSKSGYKVSMINGNSWMIISIPAKPYNLGIAAEYFYHNLITSKSTMGYDAMSGGRYSAIAEFTTKNGFFNIYLKYPFWIAVADRKEYTAAMQLNFESKKGNMKPFNFVRGSNMRIAYSSMSTQFQGLNYVAIKIQTLSITFGYAW